TFGTLVDWRGGMIAHLSSWGDARGIRADWPTLVDAWRMDYPPSLDRVRRGKRAWATAPRVLPTSGAKIRRSRAGRGGLEHARAILARAACMAGCSRRPLSVEAPLHDRPLVERTCRASCFPVQIARAAVGHDPRRRSVPALQARSGDLSRRGRAFRLRAGGSDHGRLPHIRSRRGGALWSADVLRVPEARIRRGPDRGARADARNFRLDGGRRRRTGGLAAALRAQGSELRPSEVNHRAQSRANGPR